MKVQTRDSEGGIIQHPTFKQAFYYTQRDKNVWNISWTAENGERVRMVRSIDPSLKDGVDRWIYEPIMVSDIFDNADKVLKGEAE